MVMVAVMVRVGVLTDGLLEGRRVEALGALLGRHLRELARRAFLLERLLGHSELEGLRR